MPKMRFPMSLLTCFHDRWSRRKWSSFYAAINATEVTVVGSALWRCHRVLLRMKPPLSARYPLVISSYLATRWFRGSSYSSYSFPLQPPAKMSFPRLCRCLCLRL